MSESPHQDFHESLAAYFERSVATVRRYADAIECHYARPALEIFAEKFKERPMMMTFFAIFSILSVLPILSFAGISVFVISSIVFFAAATTFLVCMAAESIIVSMAICTVFSLVLIAMLVTTFFISIYSMLRFIVLVHAGGRSGAIEWSLETKQYFLPTKREDGFDGSTMVVDHQSSQTNAGVENSDPDD